MKYVKLNTAGLHQVVLNWIFLICSSLNNAKVRSTTQYEELYRIVSAYGDLTLSWDNFLFLNVTGRNEWTSTLASPNNSFFYPSASLSYVFSDHFKMPPG